MKQGKLLPVAAMLCDDVRKEEGGLFSLMGIAAPIIGFGAFPARKRITPVLILTGVEVGMVTVGVSLRWKDEVKWEIETQLQIDEKGTGSVVPFDGLVAGFDEPGVLWLDVTIDGQTLSLQDWRIEAGPLPDAANEPES